MHVWSCYTSLLHGVEQDVLHSLIGVAPFHHHFNHIVGDDNVVNEHRTVMSGLNLPVWPDEFDNLLVLLQIPPVEEKHQYVAAVLHVQAVACAGRGREQDRYLPGISVAKGLWNLVEVATSGKRFQQTLKVVFQLVGYQHRRASCFGENTVQRLQFRVVQY